MSQVSLGRPEFVPGTPPGHPTAKFLYVIFLYRFFSLLFRPPKTGQIRKMLAEADFREGDATKQTSVKKSALKKRATFSE